MKPRGILTLLLLSGALGCDAGKASFARAAEAEAAGDRAGAEIAYREICAKGSSLCAAAQRRIERLDIEEAFRALEEGQYSRAKELFDRCSRATGEATREAAEAFLQNPELVQGLAWEQALALTDKAEALPRMEAIAEQGAGVSKRAWEWLQTNRPALLFDRVKAACKADGKGSCVEAGAALSGLYPESPESGEARALVEAERRRIVPLLGQAERLLAQRVELYDKDQLVELCMANDPMPADFSQGTCETKVLRGRRLASAEELDERWKKVLEGVHDPFFTRELAARWKKADAEGEYDAVVWTEGAGGTEGKRR